ncbi:DNA topoisomerase [Trinickia dabaoshanensis]|uniref:DNA topoisomerase n=1 Tax=Trinickia dabaoshanensis TaxID=564714 RepID=A0A2N7VCZ3_9BURK|nr:DNA topoisomerase IB [Trinickia dabaoshanensis]PMS15031.1 DNA topoisomerase [Trinickia dabaoshanensis]
MSTPRPSKPGARGKESAAAASGGKDEPRVVPVDLPKDLRYVDDRGPGITRKLVRGRFVYVDANGRRIDDENELARIRALAVPPAYTDVWICPDPLGHLQATGRDARRRKQYRYHVRWREIRDATKYERMAAFGDALPKIRARVARDLRAPGMPWEKVAATVVRLLDLTLVRVGSAEYARENGSFGLTTLRKRHAAVRGAHLRFRFRGKSGIEHDVDVDDPRIARIVRQCMDLPGRELFQYIDEQGERRPVGSSDINEYLREASGADFTAKDYRTWAGSVFALAALRRIEPRSAAEGRKHLLETVKSVASTLRNTPAVCRCCYIHPAVVEAFEAGALSDLPKIESRRGLKADEAAFATLLAREARRVKRETKRSEAVAKQAERTRKRANGKSPVPVPASNEADMPREDARLVRLLAKSRRAAKPRAIKARHA